MKFVKKKEAKKDQVVFSLDQTSEDGDHVWKNGPIFVADNYEDKGFEMTPEELLDAVENFTPAEVDYEHLPTGPLTGKLGRLETINVSDDGWTLYGTARLPKWFHDNVYKDKDGNDLPIKVSCTWDRKSKTLKKLALTDNPRVSEAVLLSAFSKNALDKGDQESFKAGAEALVTIFDKSSDRTWDGKWTIQGMHDKAASSGAICTKKEVKNSKAEFVSKSESATIQQIHDLAVAGGAECRFSEDNMPAYYSGNGENTQNGRKIMFKLSDLLSKNKINPEDVEIDVENAGEVQNSNTKDIETLRAEVAALKAEKETKAKEDEVQNSRNEVDEEKAKIQKELDDLKAEKEALLAEKTVADAKTFANELLAKKLAVPAEVDAIAAFYVQVAKDDSANSTEITFSSGGKEEKGGRVAAFKALFGTRTPHNLTVDELTGLDLTVVDSTADFNESDIVKKAAEQAAKFASERNKKK